MPIFALGASGNVVLNNLFEAAYGERSQDLTLKERQTRCNLVTTLGGMAAAAEPIITGAALLGSGTAVATVGVVGGSVYLLKEDAQNQADAEAVLTGDKTLAQVITERGSRCCQEVELKIMLTQLQPHLTVEEKLYLHESLSLHNYEISKRDLAAMGKKYLPQGFQSLDPQPIILPCQPIKERGATILVTPVAEPQPTILVTPTAEPLPMHTSGTPLDRPEPITVMIKDGIDNRLPIPSEVPMGKGLSVHSQY